MSNAVIELKNISKSFGEEDILENFSVGIKKHAFVTILGPSGCGKTTMLRLIGGFETPDSGEILFDGEKICKNHEFYEKIAKVYSLMEQYEMSNLYWFRYLYYAPKDKVSMCYEELAINYFYLDNLWASGYYFHKKISVDGFVSKQDIDPEIIDFFSGEEAKKYVELDLSEFEGTISNYRKIIDSILEDDGVDHGVGSTPCERVCAVTLQ